MAWKRSFSKPVCPPSTPSTDPVLEGYTRMNRPKRVRQVYAELQLAVGDLATASELLQAAADIVALLDPAVPAAPQFRLHVGGLPFEQWALDVAMADGGWRVMSHESDVIRPLFDVERDAVSDQIEFEHWMMEHAA